MAEGLLGGRGPVKDKVLEGQGYDERLQRADKADTWVLDILPAYVGVTSNTLQATNTLYLYYVGQLASGFRPARARLTTAVTDAGQSVVASLYMLDTSAARRRIVMVPGTYSVFPTDAGGQKTNPITSNVTLPRGTHMFMGIGGTTTTATIVGTTTSSIRNLPVLTLAVPSVLTAWPREVDLATMTRDYNDRIFDVKFFSEEAAQVFG